MPVRNENDIADGNIEVIEIGTDLNFITIHRVTRSFMSFLYTRTVVVGYYVVVQ